MAVIINKIKSSQGASRMTVHQRNEETRENCFPPVSPSTKNRWPVMENDSSSWDRNSRATSSSWPGEMEESATKKILQYWYAIEKHIYGEADESSTGLSSEECDQWKNQLIHLRLVGKGASSSSNQESMETVRKENQRSGPMEDRYIEEIFVEDNLDRSEEFSEKSRQRRLMEEQKNVLDQIFDRVCSELTKENDAVEAPSSKDLDEVLRITPAPSYSGQRWRNDRKKRENGDCRRTSAKTNNSGFEKNSDKFDITENKNRLDDDAGIIDETDTPPATRNKLGTVFNEKIVVSPVPFVVSTRESFTTLRMTPISFRAHNFKISSSEGTGRYMSSASTTNSGHRIAPSRVSQIHSAWQAPVCPTVWPKNIKLAPIDPARLPSSKNRITMIDHDAPLWIRRLSRQPNFLRTGIPYIPILLRNIESYTNLDDYTEDRIKTIETIGVLTPIDVRTASLVSTTENPECTIKLAIEHLYTEYVYPKDADGVCRGLRNAWDTVKVFGTLETRNEEVVLVVDHFVEVEDFLSCEKTLSLMAKLARTRYSLYEYDPINNGQLRSYLDELDKDKNIRKK